MKKWIFIGFGIFIFAVALVVWKMKSTPALNYKEYKVTRGDLTVTILSTGTIRPENRLEIKAPVPGRIDQILVQEGDRVKKGQILAWMSSTERAALLDAARAQGPEEVKRWEEIYKPAPIVAALPGMIIQRNIEPGQTITSQDAILVMSDRLTVKAQVDETDISKIRLHQKADIVLDAYRDQKIPATVDQIAFEARTVNNVTTYIVDVLPEKTPDFIRSGMTANVYFDQDERKDILLLSSDAIRMKNGKPVVSIRSVDGKIEDREIEAGLSDGKTTEITSGLKENDIALRAEATAAEKSGTSNPFSPFGGRRPPGSGGGGGGGHR